MKIRRLVTVAACLAFVVGTALLYGAINVADTSKAALEQQLKEALKQRVASAERAHEASQVAFEAETVTLSDLVYADNQLVEAEVASATKPEEVIAALEKHVGRMKQTENKIKWLFDMGKKGGEANEYYTAKREHESAEISLLKARIKAAK